MTALLLALVLCLGLGTTAFAGQEDGYHDPAEHWMTSNNRTVELDVNSTVTKETFLCLECGKVTSHQVFRVPEYTRDGQTALTRNVKYSDGTLMGGEGKGATMDGTPGRDAYYTGYHWCKSICENCGHINSNQGKSDYCYGNNVYVLYDCAAEFMEELPETVTIEYADDTYHKVTRTHGDYCVFCYGTHHHEHSELVRHSMETDILPQLGHQRFAVVQHCTECEYAKCDFVAAKSVVADYYGVADGQPHTITVSDLSEAGVSTVTVLLVKDKSPVADMFTAVSDKNENYSADKTDKAGQITVPAGSGYTSDGGKTTVGYEDPDRTRYTLTVKVEHYETGRPIPDAYVSIGKTGNITVKLPEGVDMDENHRIIVTVTDHKKVPQENVFVIVHSDLGGKADGHIDAAGKVAVPAVAKMERHGAYIYGYPDGTFGPSRGITRSEAAAIFARLLAEKNGDTLTADAKTKFEDIPAGAWYSGYVRYLSNAGIIYGITEKTFSPNKEITRSEVTAIAVRFFEVYGDGSEELMAQYKGFSDISPGYWAARYIEEAAIRGWIKGYSTAPSEATPPLPEPRSSPSSTVCWDELRIRTLSTPIFTASTRSAI